MSHEHAFRQYGFHMSMCGFFLMHMAIVFVYTFRSQASRHQVMGLSGMSKHVKA